MSPHSSTPPDPAWPRPLAPWFTWAPFCILALAGVTLWLLWPTLPARWVVHWGPHGRPDGWAEKTVLAVFLPLLLGALIAAGIEGLTRFILRTGRLSPTPQIAPEAVRLIVVGTAECTRIVSLGIALVCAGLALALPLYQPVRPAPLVLSVLGVILGSLALGLWRLWQNARTLQARGLGAGLEGWHVLYYSNPRDPRIWVPKLAGLGYTLNFAHRQAWVWLVALLVLPLLGVGVVLYQVFRAV